MNRSLRNQTIAWSASLAAFVLLIVFQSIAIALGSDNREFSGFLFACMGPVVLAVLALWGAWLAQWLVQERRASRWGRAQRIGRCPACGYDTSGLEGRCPECGEALPTAAWIPPEHPQDTPARSRSKFWTARRQSVAWLAVCLLLSLPALIASIPDSHGRSQGDGVIVLSCCMLPLGTVLMGAWGVWIVWHWEDSSW